jgi:signal transduction histidine kinase
MGRTELGRGVTFVLPSPGAVGTVRGDRDHLKQVVWNLFLNATQAMGGKGTVVARVDSASSDPLVLEVADNGPGIPADSLPRVFEPFFTTKERGTGLGLAMVHKIVEAHHGHIEVESEPGAGARFRVTLPRRDR